MKSRFNKGCEHDEAVVTVTAGIARTVCANCGYVAIEFDHLMCRSWPDSSNVADSDAGTEQLRVPAG